MGLKALIEKRNSLVEEMQVLKDAVVKEERAFSDDENTKFDDLEKQIQDLDATIAKVQRANNVGLTNVPEVKAPEQEMSQEEKDVRAFANYIRGTVSERADENLTYGDNGAVIPTTIANKIIKRVYEICPVYAQATHYTMKGNVTVPYYDEDDGTITVAYADEFTDLASTSGKFQSIELKGYLAGALTKVSRSLINSSDFDLTNFVVNDMAEKFARFIEGEILNGTDGKIEGLQGVKMTVEGALDGDLLIDAQEEVPDVYQAGDIWIMNHDTRKAIRKFKDANGDYMLNPDLSAQWGYTLLGKPVYCSDNMPDNMIYYGDMSGIAVHDTETVDIQILNELYAAQHAVGAVGWTELDAKVENAQKIVAVTFTESNDDDGGTASPTSASVKTASAKAAKAE